MRAMKGSGIEWIGEIPVSWETKRNKQLFFEVNERCENGNEHTLLSVSEYYGIAPKSDKISDGEFETRADSLDGYKLCKVGDIVMNIMLAWKRSTGRSEYDGIVSPAYCVYRPIEDNDTKYYHYLFRTDIVANLFKQYSTGIIDSRLRLYPEKFLALSMPVPPLSEQLAISAYLDRQCALIDSVIEKTKASIEEYKKLRQTVITQAVTKGVRGERAMKDSGIEWIGEIPEEFVRRKLKSFADMISKGTTPKEMNNEFDDNYTIRFLKSENIVDQHLSPVPLFTITKETHTGFLNRSQLDERDILFVIAGASIGKCAIMDKTLLPANTNQATCFIRIQSKYIGITRYIWYALQSNIMKTYISLFAVQSAQPNISMEDLGNFFIPLPKKADEISAIISFLDQKCAEIDNLITQKEQFLTELESYKRSMIYEYVTGKKEVSQA